MSRAVLGPSGTFSEEAANNYWAEDYDGQVANSIDELFFWLDNKRCSDILIPLENSQAGIIETSLINLVKYEVCIKGEINLPIKQSLLASQPYQLEEIELLVSQLAVYGQCKEYINQFLSKARTEITTSTTRAVQIVKGERKRAAAIAHNKAASLYDLHIITEDIQNSNNITRFIHVAKVEPELFAADKASLIFSLPDYPGSLSDSLKLFAKYSLNLTKIISSPDPKSADKYSFYLDIDIKDQINDFQNVLQELRLNGIMVKYLGAYNSIEAS